jgi:hypothetical protein
MAQIPIIQKILAGLLISNESSRVYIGKPGQVKYKHLENLMASMDESIADAYPGSKVGDLLWEEFLSIEIYVSYYIRF